MVKVWDLVSCVEMRSFGGHTGTVTSVLLLNEEQSARICTSQCCVLLLCTLYCQVYCILDVAAIRLQQHATLILSLLR